MKDTKYTMDKINFLVGYSPPCYLYTDLELFLYFLNIKAVFCHARSSITWYELGGFHMTISQIY